MRREVIEEEPHATIGFEISVHHAAVGCSVVVHAATPAGYRNWKGRALPMLESSIAAARCAGARLVLPGTPHNFGPDAFPLVREATPQRPETRKGRIRVSMEERLKAAATEGLRVLIVRAGDFFGPRRAILGSAKGS
jgi:nucleoside-diphosphate-sugar epimerase